MMNAESLLCPVCGFTLQLPPYSGYEGPASSALPTEPPYEDFLGTPSYEVCRCCGFEFGNDDNPGTSSPESFEDYRAAWLASGGKWFDPAARPEEWDRGEQLARVM